MTVLGIAGSLRAGSFNAQLLRLAAEELPEGVELEAFDGLAEIPPYDHDLEGLSSPAVDRLKAAIAEADAILVATPEYNGSIPGALKNALDWASRPFPDNCLRGKPVAVIGASTGLFGARWAQAELRKVLNTIGASVLATELAVASAHEAFTPDRRLGNPRLAATLCSIVSELLERTLRDAA